MNFEQTFDFFLSLFCLFYLKLHMQGIPCFVLVCFDSSAELRISSLIKDRKIAPSKHKDQNKALTKKTKSSSSSEFRQMRRVQNTK